MIRQDKMVRVAISGKHYAALKQHLFPGDNKEAVAFALCGRARREDLELLTVREIVPIPYDACRVRTQHRVTWLGEFLEHTLVRATTENLGLVKLHSHPTGYPWFSDTDDVAEAELFPSLFGWLDSEAPLASMIMLPDGSFVGRAVHPRGGGDHLDCIRVASENFIFWRDRQEFGNIQEHGIRIAQAFGNQTYGLLRKLRIGVVGCSGTGSIVIEQLARNCVGELVLVDPDHVEYKNLNRILNSTMTDAECRTAKTKVLKLAIERMGLGTKVIAFDGNLMKLEILKVLSTCDILIGCMDSIDGRHVLNKLASAYLIPLIDVGVRLEADGTGSIDSIWATVHTLLPGGSSLLSRLVYNHSDLESAFLKRSNPDVYEEKRNLGYIKGIREDQPAVISVNMTAAAAAVNELLARLHPYRLKPNRNFAIRRISLTDSEADSNELDGEPCSYMERLVGVGDQYPFLGIRDLGDSE